MPQAARRDCGPQPRRAIAALDRRLAVSTKTLGVSIGEETGNGPYMQDAEMIAQELSLLGHKLEDVKKRLADVEKVNRRLEDARPGRLPFRRGSGVAVARPEPLTGPDFFAVPRRAP
jgi:hypothetical protein